MNGSDTLFDVTKDIIDACPAAKNAPGNLKYLGGGSGVGAGAMSSNTQQMSPMSRALKNTEYCAIAGVDSYRQMPPINAPADANASAHLASGLLLGIDGIAIVTNRVNSCSTTTANAVVTTGGSMAVTTGGLAGDPAATDCTGCGAGTATYTFNSQFDALKLLYFGLHHTTDNKYDCASPARKTLIRQWNKLFATACTSATCPNGITHAWRRGDLSGTTDAFVSILAGGDLPARNGTAVGLGSLKKYNSPKVNPFCNTFDSTIAAPVSTDRSFADGTTFNGYNDFGDNDPIKTNCTTPGGNGEDVCGPLRSPVDPTLSFGALGVVLPVVLPDSNVVSAAEIYQGNALNTNLEECSSSCIQIAPAKSSNLGAGFKCPGGNAPTGGLCFVPYKSITVSGVTTQSPECYVRDATAMAPCADVNGKADARSYNLPVIVPMAQIPTDLQAVGATAAQFQYAVDANFRYMSGSFYRIHARTAGVGSVPNAAAGTTGKCSENDDTSQIGCLTDAEPCSVGFAGKLAARSFPGVGTPAVPTDADTKALQVGGVTPTDANISNLFTGTAPVYPLARRLYVASIYGFNNLHGGESAFGTCLRTNSIVSAAITGHNFVTVPAGGGHPGGVKCLDYPENVATTSVPAPNVPGTGSEALGGCGLGLTNTDACSGVTISP